MDLMMSGVSASQNDSLESFLRCALFVTAIFVVVLCGFLLLRRVAGALDQPLTSAEFAVVAVISLSGCAAFRVVWLLTRREDDYRGLRWWLVLPSLCLVLLAIAVTIPNTPHWTLGLFWFAILASEMAWWGVGTGAVRAPRAVGTISFRRVQAPSRDGLSDDGGSVTDEPTIPNNVTQQLTRSEDEGGGENLYGLVRARFVPGERLQQVHIAFCPPFANKPTLTAFAIDGPPATVKVAQLESFGTRLELRLPSGAEQNDQLLLELTARCDPAENATNDSENR